MKTALCLAYETSSQRLRTGYQRRCDSLHHRFPFCIHWSQPGHPRSSSQTLRNRIGRPWENIRRRLLLPQQNPWRNSGQLYKFMAGYSKIICADWGGDKEGRSWAFGPFWIVKHRLLPYVLQMGDLSASETIYL